MSNRMCNYNLGGILFIYIFLFISIFHLSFHLLAFLSITICFYLAVSLCIYLSISIPEWEVLVMITDRSMDKLVVNVYYT